ncbi:MAG: manganese efflux pump [Clostridia bacterium]|nr:manganese efflux pump [Clostridia bacterium]
MNILDMILIGIGLAMDACAVAICKGLAMKEKSIVKALIIAGYFAVFQMVMPLIGFFLGDRFKGIVESIDHWIAFGLLVLIGANMIREALSKKDKEETDDVSPKIMIPLAIATSIDALVAGVTFAFLDVNLPLCIAIIGIITFGLCVLGVVLGRLVGQKLKKKAELIGGIILICLGVKILLEHLHVFG